MAVDLMSVDENVMYKMTVDEMTVDEMTVDKMVVDQMTCCNFFPLSFHRGNL
jgi:hypothetical protein